MPITPHRKNPTLYIGTKAEGICGGLPYNTELVNADGVTVHFWVQTAARESLLATACDKIIMRRDVVSITWCYGEPAGYWAHEDIP
jgi:hypothetical protein